MRIIYALSGEGMGHATRSKAVIEELQKNHDIVIACGGRAFKYMAGNFDKVVPIQKLGISYRDNRVSTFGTFAYNLGNLTKHYKSFKRMNKLIKKFRPQLIINDFEYQTNYLAFIHKIPNMIIDNEQIITKADVKFPARFWWDYFKSWLAIKLISPKPDFRFITSFFFPRLKVKNAAYCPPIIRKEIRKAKPGKEDYFLIYQTSDTNKRLLKVLRQFNEKFVVYGFNSDNKESNIHFRKFDEKQFVKDLAGCKGIVINGNFCVMAEALHLKKPILSIPVEKQFEQVLNAIYLQRLGYGMNARTAGYDVIKKFISNIPVLEKGLQHYQQDNPDLFFMQLEQKIEQMALK